MVQSKPKKSKKHTKKDCLCCSKCGKQFHSFILWKKHESKCRYNPEKYVAYLINAMDEDQDISFLDNTQQEIDDNQEVKIDDGPNYMNNNNNNYIHNGHQIDQKQQYMNNGYNGYTEHKHNHIQNSYSDIPPPPNSVPPPPSSSTILSQMTTSATSSLVSVDVPPPPSIGFVPPPPPLDDANVIRYNENEMSEILSKIPDKVPIWSRLFVSTSNDTIAQRLQSLQNQTNSYIKCTKTSAYKDYRDVIQMKMFDLLLSTPKHNNIQHRNGNIKNILYNTNSNTIIQHMEQPERTKRAISISLSTPSQRLLEITKKKRKSSEPIQPKQNIIKTRDYSLNNPIQINIAHTQNAQFMNGDSSALSTPPAPSPEQPPIPSPTTINLNDSPRIDSLQHLHPNILTITQSSKIRYHHTLPSVKMVKFKLQDSITELTDAASGRGRDGRTPKGEESDVDDYDVRVSDTVDDTDYHIKKQLIPLSHSQPASDNEATLEKKKAEKKKHVQFKDVGIVLKQYENAANVGIPPRSKSSFNLTITEPENIDNMNNNLQPLNVIHQAIKSDDVKTVGQQTDKTIDTDDTVSSSLSALGNNSKLDQVKKSLDALSPKLIAKESDAIINDIPTIEDKMSDKKQQQEQKKNSSDEEVSSLPSLTDDNTEEKRSSYKNSKLRVKQGDNNHKDEWYFADFHASLKNTNPLAKQSGYHGSMDMGSMDFDNMLNFKSGRNSMSVNPLVMQSSAQSPNLSPLQNISEENMNAFAESPISPLDMNSAGFTTFKSRVSDIMSTKDEDNDGNTYYDKVIELILEFSGLNAPIYLDGYLMLHQMVFDIYTKQYNDIWYKYRLPIWLNLLFNQDRMSELETHYKTTKTSNNYENGKLKWIYSLHDMIYYDETLFTHLIHNYGIPPSLQSLIWYHLSHNHHIPTDLDIFCDPLTWNNSDAPMIDNIFDVIFNKNYMSDIVQVTLMKSYVFQPHFHHNGHSYDIKRTINSKNKGKLLPNLYYPQYRYVFYYDILHILLKNIWIELPSECQSVIYGFWVNIEQQTNGNNAWLFGDIDNLLSSEINNCEFIMSIYLWDGMIGIGILLTSLILIAIHSKKSLNEFYIKPLISTEIGKLRKVYKFVYEYIVNNSEYDNDSISLTVIKQLCNL